LSESESQVVVTKSKKHFIFREYFGFFEWAKAQIIFHLRRFLSKNFLNEMVDSIKFSETKL